MKENKTEQIRDFEDDWYNIVNNWQEPEWQFERHDKLIEFTKSAFINLKILVDKKLSSQKQEYTNKLIEKIAWLKDQYYENEGCSGETDDNWCCKKHREITKILDTVLSIIKEK